MSSRPSFLSSFQCRGKKPQILNRLKAALAARAAPEEAGQEEPEQRQGETAGAEETVDQPPEDEQPLSPVQPELEPESEPESEPIVATVEESERKSEDDDDDDKRTKRDRRWSDAMEEDEGEVEEEEEETDTKTRKRRKQQKEEEDGDEREKLRDESRISKHRKKLEQNERRRIRSNQPATRPWSDPEELTRDEIAIELKKRNYPVRLVCACVVCGASCVVPFGPVLILCRCLGRAMAREMRWCDGSPMSWRWSAAKKIRWPSHPKTANS